MLKAPVLNTHFRLLEFQFGLALTRLYRFMHHKRKLLNLISSRHTTPTLPGEVRVAAHEHFKLKRLYLDERKHALYKAHDDLCHRSVHITSDSGTYLPWLR
jgi:hypothetical protein